MMSEAELSTVYLRDRLSIIEERVRAAVARRRDSDPDLDDRFRGLYLSDRQIDKLLAEGGRHPESPDEATSHRLIQLEAEADRAEGKGSGLRLRDLARSFLLDDFDVEVLLIALAPDVDPRFEQFYGYLNDDVSMRRASVGLALHLCGSEFEEGTARSRFGPKGSLIESSLVTVEDPDRPFLTRGLLVPDRIIAHLLGDDHPDNLIATAISDFVDLPEFETSSLERALSSGVDFVYLREKPGATGTSAAASALARSGRTPLVIDLGRLDVKENLLQTVSAATREARLRNGGLVVGPIEAIVDHPEAIRAFAERRCPTLITGARGWDPNWSQEIPLLIDSPIPGHPERLSIWKSTLGDLDGKEINPAAATSQFRLNPDQIKRAARAAKLVAISDGRKLDLSDLYAGARSQNSAGLERLAVRIEPQVSWEDLVLPEVALAQLRELTARIRHRDRVLDEWGVATRSSKGRGISALFAGESGTGKTMSAEVVAEDLGLDLYIIDLSTVIDKYVGETEKNLERIFVEADRVNGVLLFDEADAIFGKRSETRDAQDRFANIEIAYLLQRMERFDGLAILTTNLRANVDEAFTRRLDAIVDFPMPEIPSRLDIWKKNIRPGIPRAEDIDLEFLASRFRLSGGEIRNIAVTAAYLAADENQPVSMTHLIKATEREYRKMGRLCVEDEFGPYFPLVASGSAF